MAQLVTVTAVCDPHGDKGKEVSGHTIIFGIDGVWYAAEGCEPCDHKLFDAVRALADKHGRILGKESLAKLRKVANAETGSVSQLPAKPLKPVAPAATEPTSTQPAHVAKGKGRPGIKSKKPQRYFCMFGCDPEAVRWTSSTAMLTHMDKKHGITGSMVEVFGLDCPLCGSYADSGKLGVHLQRRHKGLTVPEAFAKAQADGDRHGIAAKILGQVG
jgi:hypothetical protein